MGENDERDDLLKVILGIAIASSENFEKTGDTYQAANALKGLQMVFELRGWDKEGAGEKESLLNAKVLDELTLMNDQLMGKKRRRVLKPRGKAFTKDYNPRGKSKALRGEEEGPTFGDKESLPFTGPPTP